MPNPPGFAPRPLSGSRSFQASQSQAMSASSSRPFLNMLNPMARTYQGYSQANQSLLEEEEENRASSSEEDVEAGQGSTTETIALSKSKSQGKRRISWDAGVPDINALRPNTHQDDDKIPGRPSESSDDEVPQSFMIEAASRKVKVKSKAQHVSPTPTPTGRRQPLHSVAGRHLPPILPTHATRGPSVSLSIPPRPSEIEEGTTPRPSSSARARAASVSASEPFSDHSRQTRLPMRGLDAYERALWNWVNVYNLDAFLQEVYYYYEGKGIYSIALARGLNLLTVGFVIGFSTFLLGCVDYSRIRPEKVTRLSDVVVSHCVTKFSGFTLLFFLLFTAFYTWQLVSFVLGIVRLVDMYNFYTHLLRIPDADIQTISWPEIVRRIGAIRQENPLTAISSSSSSKPTNDTTTAKLDAHDIANRIMRQENYLIALFNKELLDLRIPLPHILKRFVAEEKGKGKMLTRALEWNLRFCLMEYLFDQHGRVRKVFLKAKNRRILIEGLERRFIFMGILNAIFAPFIVLYLLMYSFFRYFEEYHKNPSSIGGRRYTPFAQWKFREFNELPHLFARRLDESYPIANIYIGQFPNEKVSLIMRFVAFVAGSFAAVLLLASVIDPNLFTHFEVTPNRTVLFYIGVFSSILAVARGMVPDDNEVFDPELLMTEVISYTHYMPDEWKGELHSKKVHQAFGELFAMKIMIFGQEILSVLLTPLVLWLSLPACAPAIIDFFREFSVHVDGRGYVCSFAEFNFERHGNVKFGAPTRVNDRKMISNEGKMEKSFLNFKAANPDWNPTDPSGSLYLSRMADLARPHAHGHAHLHSQSYLRRRPGTPGGTGGETGAVHFDERKAEVALTDRAHEYDRALRQSQHAAATRRRQGGSVLGVSGIGSTVVSTTAAAGPSAESIFGLAMAQTAVLGDEEESISATGAGRGAGEQSQAGAIPDDDMAPDGGVGSGLGGSYVDGAKRGRPFNGVEEEEEGMEDGGVLGLLAQIYGTRNAQGPARVI